VEEKMPEKICALCGSPILKKPKNDPDSGTVEHVPASLFYPKSLRSEIRKPLWTVPSHRRCNAAYKSDEEYFYNHFYGLVGVENQGMGKIILDDLRRQAKHSQAQNLIKRILRNCKNVSPGGILLPSTLVWVDCEGERIDRVLLKIAQCLFYKDHKRFLPKENCGYLRLYKEFKDVPETFLEMMKTRPQSVDPKVFLYWHLELEGCHYYVLAFWTAFAFGMVFRDPAVAPDVAKMIVLT
jgi:hypothetical protein